MKTYLVSLFVAILAIQTHAADLETQLLGYWAPDTDKTVGLAKKENRKVDFFLEKIMPKMTFEFEQGKMMIHIRGNKAENPPDLFTVKSVDEESNTLVLEVKNGEAERKATINGDQLTLVWQKQTVALNRISKEAFESRFTPPPPAAEGMTKVDIPATPAMGSVHGVAFRVEKATLSKHGILTLRQGGGFIPDQAFEIFTFGGSAKELTGKTILAKADRLSVETVPHIYLQHKVEGRGSLASESFSKGYTMKLEFGAVSGGVIPGKIHLRLPDAAKSFVAGTFEAVIK